MKKIIIIIVLLFASNAFASKIGRINISGLESRSELIVIAKVSNIESDSALDKVTIDTSKVLKGTPTNDEIIILLQVRGGLKEFDPQLQKGDFGVFFLRKGSSFYRTAHGGALLFLKRTILSK